jgi:hypothetical protein
MKIIRQSSSEINGNSNIIIKMAKIKIKKDLLNKPRGTIIGQGIINGVKVVAVTGAIGDWAGYTESSAEQTYEDVAQMGNKIYTTEIEEYFEMLPGVKEKYRR